ncbi:MAG: helix-turn-helix domain-containing protein, partial [Patescibacteria group bacterium]
EPGAGKTHVVNEFVQYLHDHNIEVAITASTGIAATHIGGLTIHSWSGIGIKKELSKYDIDKIASTEYVSKRVRRSKVLIIDEVSMLSPSTLSMVDAVCREVKQKPMPFGGLQVVFVGDFFQLPPIVRYDANSSPQTVLIDEVPKIFACDSDSWKRAELLVCYLTEQYRQDDKEFLSVLSAIRDNSFGDEHLEHLKSRKVSVEKVPANVPKLFSHNLNVDEVNTTQLGKIKDKEEVFLMSREGHDALTSILQKGCLSPEMLCLKIGAEVMFTKNNQKEGYVNGTLGTVIGFEREYKLPIVKTRSGQKIAVDRADWIVEENGKSKAKISQIPLRLAWAITVHKSQGMSLDEAVMDLSRVFEYGQGYVALSRVRRLSGLYLLGWNQRTFQVHPEILLKDESFRKSSEDARVAFSKIPSEELEKMYNNFILSSDGQLKSGSGKKSSSAQGYERTRPDTKLVTWDLLKNNKDKTIADIAKLRGIKIQTIFSHIEDLVEAGKADKKDFKYLLSPWVSADLSKIHSAFRGLNTTKLTPVYEKFNEKYSFDDLRLARLFLD